MTLSKQMGLDFDVAYVRRLSCRSMIAAYMNYRSAFLTKVSGELTRRKPGSVMFQDHRTLCTRQML